MYILGSITSKIQINKFLCQENSIRRRKYNFNISLLVHFKVLYSNLQSVIDLYDGNAGISSFIFFHSLIFHQWCGIISKNRNNFILIIVNKSCFCTSKRKYYLKAFRKAVNQQKVLLASTQIHHFRNQGVLINWNSCNRKELT